MARKKRSVLITGVSHPWGRNLVPLLEEDPEFDQIIGMDFRKPETPFKRVEFFQVDLHNPLIPELLQVAEVDTVCHLMFLDTYASNEEYFDQNVMGTMDLLAACAAGGIERVIIKSDTKVYGAESLNPNYLNEYAELRGRHYHRYIQDRVELERMMDRFSRQNVSPRLCILRFANILGRAIETPETRYLDSSVVPTVIGYDPLMQFIHEKDVLAALYHTIKCDATGVFNVSGEGALPLSQVLRIGGKANLPVPATLLKFTSDLWRKAGKRGVLESIPIEAGYLKYACLGDTTRMKEWLRFYPQRTSKQAVIDFYEHLRIRRYMPKKTRIRSDPLSSEKLQEWIRSRRRASDYLTDLIETFNKEGEHDQ
ncbi:MAG: NAD-dependent epimerase/dehydratase family protein [Thermodesulfobacteriota bacterium]